MKVKLALLVLALTSVPAAAPAGNRMPLPPGYRLPVRPQPVPSFTPCIDYAYLPAVMGPCQGPVGGTIRVRLRRDLGSPAAVLSFKAVVSRGVPARVSVRLQGRGPGYAIAAPPQLCTQGGGSWEMELILANGRNMGVIGGYTPTNCPR